mmetsp:Transcript_21831/g.47674  ORF Transcript_21831/g.47674 Transcript_21831/m.47674 type:complete len:618 (+) Transcript_21831:103-1956(+)
MISTAILVIQLVLIMSSTSPSSSFSSAVAAAATAPAAAPANTPCNGPPTPPIVYTIAGSDSGGGAGIQADLHAIHAMGCHGCSAITCLTAQSSTGVTGVHAPPVDFLREQLDVLVGDMPPRAVKIGMLGTEELAVEVGRFLREIKSRAAADAGSEGARAPPFVVLDPVMISTSGHKLIDDDAKAAMIEHVFSQADVLTPNKFEAEALLGRELNSPEDVEAGAKELLGMGVKSVLIKGGHSLAESKSSTPLRSDLNATVGYAQDYFLSTEPPLDADGEERICDGCRGVWLRSDRYDSQNTHGTGCTLSSAIASALAIGHQQRDLVSATSGTGAARAVYAIDACCLAKAYVTAGIGKGVQLGKGPGPVVHTKFPSSHLHFPSIILDPKKKTSETPAFLPMVKAQAPSAESRDKAILGKILPIVDSAEWVERLAKVKGITDIQLRIKNEHDPERILATVKQSQKACNAAGVRLWINDFWEAAVEAGCFGVHLGQEDLTRCVDNGGLAKLHERNMALGISTHSYAELSAAIGVRPSYISLGPVFGTSSKNVAFDPQGLATVYKWRELLCPDMPLVAIGGINDKETAAKVKGAGADCIAVIGAVTKADDVDAACQMLIDAME